MAKRLHKVEFVEQELEELQARLEASLPVLGELEEIQIGFQKLHGQYLELKTLTEQAKAELRNFNKDGRDALDYLSSEQASYRKSIERLKQETMRQLDQQKKKVEARSAEMEEELKRDLVVHQQSINELRTELCGNIETMKAKLAALIEEGHSQMKKHQDLFENLERTLKNAIEHKMRAFGVLFVSANILAVIALAASLFAAFGR